MDRRLCEPRYANGNGRPSVPPGVYFRMLLVGYFEGINSQRGIAWRCSDSLSLREFLGIPLSEDSPDHSSLSYIHQRLALEVHEAMFVWVLTLLQEKKLLAGKAVGVDSTTLVADAAMKSIVRHDTGEACQEYLTRLSSSLTGGCASSTLGYRTLYCDMNAEMLYDEAMVLTKCSGPHPGRRDAELRQVLQSLQPAFSGSKRIGLQ